MNILLKNKIAIGGAACILASLLTARYGGAARLRPEPPKIEKDAVYGEIKMQGGNAKPLALKMDVYEPQGFRGRRPGVIMVHGGGWIGGDKAQYEKFGTELAAQGYVAFSLNYRLLPFFPHPAQIDDVQRAVRWVRAHADTYHLDPKRIGALGDSAGGHLVSLLGTWDTRDNSDAKLAKYSSKVQCVVDLYGPADFTVPSQQASDQARQLVTLFFGGKKQEDAPELYKEGSPVVHVSKKSAPFLIMHGDKDPLVPLDQSQRLDRALKQAGVESTLVIFANEGHGFSTAEDQKKRDELAADFLKKHLKP